MATLSFGCGWPTLLVPPSSCTTLSSKLSVLPLRSTSCHHSGIPYAAASKSTTTATAAKREPRGIAKPCLISSALQELVGVPEIPRTQALKQIWAYIKENNLQDPDNKKIIICDEKLRKVLGGKERVGFLEIAGLISPHFLK
ncbi:TRI1 protein [Nymphaea thermarum]|nr:TRI1 protein [Nymphaea thermarum]